MYSGKLSQFRNLAPHHADLAVEGGPTGAIDDATVLDQEVVGHGVLRSRGFANEGNSTPVRRALSSAGCAAASCCLSQGRRRKLRALSTSLSGSHRRNVTRPVHA